MTDLEKRVARRSSATRFEKSKRRAVIASLEPTREIGLRLEGTRQTYRVDLEVVYEFAVRLWVNEVEKRTKELMREGMKKNSARMKARKELAEKLKSWI